MLHGGSAAPSIMLLFGLRAARVAVEVADGKPQLQGTGSTQHHEDKWEINQGFGKFWGSSSLEAPVRGQLRDWRS